MPSADVMPPLDCSDDLAPGRCDEVQSHYQHKQCWARIAAMSALQSLLKGYIDPLKGYIDPLQKYIELLHG